MRKFWIAGIALLFIGMACSNDMEDIEALMENFDTRKEVAEEVEILYSDSAIVRVRITGPVMNNYISYRENKQEFPEGVYVEFFDASGNITSQLTAQYGLRMPDDDEVIVRDSVVWQSIEGEKLETEELIWDERKQKVYTNKFVVVTRPDEIIYGHGFEADQDFSYSRINAIEGRLKVDEPAEQTPEQ